MTKCATVFSRFDDIPEMRCEEIQNVSDDVCLLISFLNETVNIISSDVVDLLMEMCNMFNFAVSRRRAIDNNVCCVHSKIREQILQSDCLECKRMQVIIISDNEEKNEKELENVFEIDEWNI